MGIGMCVGVWSTSPYLAYHRIRLYAHPYYLLLIYIMEEEKELIEIGIRTSLRNAEQLPNSREKSLVITKLQEALLRLSLINKKI